MYDQPFLQSSINSPTLQFKPGKNKLLLNFNFICIHSAGPTFPTTAPQRR